MAFERVYPVRFQEVDWARVVFYPRFFTYCHQAFEDFFEAEVGLSYAEVIRTEAAGFPTVHTTADFKSPLAHGDRFRARLTVTKLSSRSVRCRYRLLAEPDGRLAFDGEVVVVCVDTNTFKPKALPGRVRAAFERHLEVERAD